MQFANRSQTQEIFLFRLTKAIQLHGCTEYKKKKKAHITLHMKDRENFAFLIASQKLLIIFKSLKRKQNHHLHCPRSL